MKRSFTVLLVVAIAYFICSCGKDGDVVVPDPPDNTPSDTTLLEPDSNSFQCYAYNAYIALFVINKDSTDILDVDYPWSGQLKEGCISINKVYYAETSASRPEIGLENFGESQSHNYLLIDCGVDDSYFHETGDSVSIGGSIFEKRIALVPVGIEWTNGDIDTFMVRCQKTCAFDVDNVVYRDSTIVGSDVILVKKLN